ncbi:MAG: class I SAM-dependent methyltransferase [Polyangiaceae bacterium]|nr:class I SAM-dependent methyltransferase [Polyangiaceae bacterium]
MPTQTTTDRDPSNGYEAVASEFVERRDPSSIGVATVRTWAQSLRPGASILDLGCGHGVPISMALMNDGFTIHGVDASPSLAAAFRRQFPHAQIACETVEDSRFFGRTFDGIISVGLMFLLPADAQRRLIHKVAPALNPGGKFLFTSPALPCTWKDVLTGRESLSLGRDEYRAILSTAGLTLIAEYVDDGQNHYYDAHKT